MLTLGSPNQHITGIEMLGLDKPAVGKGVAWEVSEEEMVLIGTDEDGGQDWERQGQCHSQSRGGT